MTSSLIHSFILPRIVVKLSFYISIVVLTEQEAEFEDQKNELEKRIEENEKKTEKL